MTLPILRLYECGCTTGHDSLIRLWVPEHLTSEDLEHVKAMWTLMVRQLERGVVAGDPPKGETK